MGEEETAYICGKKATTLKKLMAASGSIMALIGRYCGIAGKLAERQRGHDYVQWILSAFRGNKLQVDVEERSDVLQMNIPESHKHLLRFDKLKDIERETSTFLQWGRNSAGGDMPDVLLIFGYSPTPLPCDSCRVKARTIIDGILADRLE